MDVTDGIEPAAEAATERARRTRVPVWLIAPVAIAVWWLVYSNLQPAADWLIYTAFGLPMGSHLASALAFFVFEVPKVLMLLAIVVFAVGIVRTFFTPERTRKALAGRRESVGNVLAAGLGVVTPFCSCSAVPLFIGFVESGVPLGVTFSFLISAPMVNEVAIVLLFGMVGSQVALTYVATGLLIAIVSGWVIGRLHMEKHVEEWVYELQAEGGEVDEDGHTWATRVAYGRQAVREIVGKVLPYLVVGIGVGAGIHGYVPEDAMAGIMGRGAWWSVPVAVVLGVPMYSNAAGIIPIIQALMEKGAALGTALAFMMAVIALSLPEAVILRKVLKPRLLLTFFGVVAAGIVFVGYVFNLLW